MILCETTCVCAVTSATRLGDLSKFGVIWSHKCFSFWPKVGKSSNIGSLLRTEIGKLNNKLTVGANFGPLFDAI